MTATALNNLNDVLRPAAPPLVIEGVYSDDQHARLLEIVKDNGPWPTITAHHFTTVDELIATTSGVVPEGHGLTLDDIATANFRGFLAENSCCFFPEIRDCFYNAQFLDLAKDYWGAQHARPTMMLFNIGGPAHSGLSPHLDAVTFRGARIEDTPIWIQNMMGKSGLFREYVVKMAQIVSWFWLGAEGTFTCWPEGPLGQPMRIEHPMWNKGVLVQNEMMFHRGDPVGRPDERDITGLKHRSMFGYQSSSDDWAITTDNEVVRTYEPSNIRFLVHWNAEVYMDRAEAKLVMDHTDDISIDRIVNTFMDDLAMRGIPCDAPSATDPFHDPAFIRALMNAYTIAPTTDWIENSNNTRMSS